LVLVLMLLLALLLVLVLVLISANRRTKMSIGYIINSKHQFFFSFCTRNQHFFVIFDIV